MIKWTVINTVFVACMCSLVSCASLSPKDKGVRIGMTMDEVQVLMGSPNRKSDFSCPEYAKNCPEIWHYYSHNVTFSDNIVVSSR